MENTRASSYDLDDTVIGRELLARVGAVVKAKLQPPKTQIPPLGSIPDINHDPVDLPLPWGPEAISFLFHEKREVLPGVRETLATVRSKGIDIFGNTGRSSKKVWVDMTMATLERGNVANLFQKVFFTPDDTRSSISKIGVLQALRTRYGSVDHYEDDPRTARNIAAVFPDMTVFLVTYATTGLLFSRKELDKFPNIKRVGFVGEPHGIKP